MNKIKSYFYQVIVSRIFITLIAVSLAGCAMNNGRTGEESAGIRYPAFFSKRNIIIPVKLTYHIPSGSSIQFGTKSSIDQISEALKEWDSNVVVEVHEKSLFVSSENPEDGKYDYYFIYEYDDPDKLHRYVLSNFMVFYSEDDYYVEFIVPMHLLCYDQDNPLNNLRYGDGKMYEMVSGATIEDIYDFYNDSGYYEVIRRDNTVILEKTYFDHATQSNEDKKNIQMELPIMIETREKEGKIYFSCIIGEG